MKKKETKPAIIYTRVSTAGQAVEGVSLDMQEGKARQWAEANGFPVEGFFVDRGISGRKMENRPALLEALDAVCKCSGVLVVYSLSRLARSTAETILIADRLDNAGADLMSLTEKIDTTSAAGKMVFRVLAVLAEFERDVIAERILAAIHHKRDHGEVYNNTPLGFDRDGKKLIPNNDERKTIQKIFRLRKRGLPLQKIADRLNAEGCTGKNGGRFYASTIQKILNNPIHQSGV
jgi:DNA invertase Pin-like site-specific DNA recombinase